MSTLKIQNIIMNKEQHMNRFIGMSLQFYSQCVHWVMRKVWRNEITVPKIGLSIEMWWEEKWVSYVMDKCVKGMQSCTPDECIPRYRALLALVLDENEQTTATFPLRKKSPYFSVKRVNGWRKRKIATSLSVVCVYTLRIVDLWV
jgi:hypothetical protein